jgi:hypothetical protein
MARHRPQRGKPFTPFKPPTRPPAGLYDPGLDSQERAGQRGYEDLQADTGTQQSRLGISSTEGAGQINDQYQRSLSDVLLARQREGAQYGQQTSDLKKNYSNLASNQNAAANAAGILGSSGYDQQSSQARGVNQQHDQGLLDTSHNQAVQDSATEEQRLGSARDLALGQNAQGYQWNTEDLGTQLGRAGRENTALGQDLNEARFFQAGQLGFAAPTRRPGENTAYGLTYRRNADKTATLSSGRMVSAGGLHNLLLARKRKGVHR